MQAETGKGFFIQTKMEYEKFLESKRHSIGDFGFEATFIPDIAFDFQKYIIKKAVKKGRIGIFCDTGFR